MPEPEKPADLLDLQLLPAWVKEPAGGPDYSQYEGEDPRRGDDFRDRRDRGGSREGRRPAPRGRKPDRGGPGGRERRDPRDKGARGRSDRRPERARPERAPMVLPTHVQVRFLPHRPPLDNVIAQIKGGAVAYSVFALARLFLDKPERYNVLLTATEELPLSQLGETGAVAVDRKILEGAAFLSARDEYYKAETTQTEPIKGNFSNVARDRASGTLLGPTNHHAYQTQLRALYEQRYSRRMSFPEFQRGIEIVGDPAVVEEWKEQARTVTTYTTLKEDPEISFKSLAEAERHFREKYLPDLIRSTVEATVDGVTSRRLADRALSRQIENAWSAEVRSPSKMMAELVGALREAGLNIFRHRRGMLFVTPVRHRPFRHEAGSVSAGVATIFEAIAASTGGTSRKEIADKLLAATAEGEREKAKLNLASDLRWLVGEGYVIEFNDGTLDLPKIKPPAAAKPAAAGETAAPVAAEEAEKPVEAEAMPAVAEETPAAPAGEESPAQAEEASPEDPAAGTKETDEPAS